MKDKAWAAFRPQLLFVIVLTLWRQPTLCRALLKRIYCEEDCKETVQYA